MTPLKHRLIVATAVTVVLLVILPAAAMAVYFRPPAGDLTRIGAWAERDFVALRPSPALHVHANHPAVSAGVVVIGDSFSAHNKWQSVVMDRSAAPLATFLFTGDQNCYASIIDGLIANAQTRPRLIVLESVERYFYKRFAQAQHCPTNEPPQLHAVAEGGEPAAPPRLQIDYVRQWSVVFHRLEQRLFPERLLGDEVLNVGLSTRQFFSNVEADRLLYFHEDAPGEAFDPVALAHALDTLAALRDRLAAQDVALAVLAVPDKSHVYEPWLRSQKPRPGRSDIQAALARQHIQTVDLLAVLREASQREADIYLANDTHLADAGYRAMGEAVARAAWLQAPR